MNADIIGLRRWPHGRKRVMYWLFIEVDRWGYGRHVFWCLVSFRRRRHSRKMTEIRKKEIGRNSKLDCDQINIYRNMKRKTEKNRGK
jgi:hypothetical protein